MKKSVLIFVIMLTGGTVLRAQTPVIWTGSTSAWSTRPPSAAEAASILAALGASTPRIAAPTPANPLNERIVIVPTPAPTKPLSETEASSLERARHEEEQYARRHAQTLTGIYRRALEPVSSDSALATPRETDVRDAERRALEPIAQDTRLERETAPVKADVGTTDEELTQAKPSREVEKQDVEAARKADEIAARLKAAQAALEAEREKGGR